jgi:hypothetical protein
MKQAKDTAEMIAEIKRFLDLYGRNCVNCEHLSEDNTDTCSKYHARPPASVIVMGCDIHEWKIPY